MPDQVAGRLSPWLRRRRMQMARPYLRGRVLDYGCGVGVLADWIAPDRFLGVERDGDSLALARQMHPKHRFSTEMPRDSRFETIVALAVLEHLPDPAQWLRELKKALAPGGKIVLTTPHPYFEWVHTFGARLGFFSAHACEEHEQLMGRRDLRKLAEICGLRMEKYRRFLFGCNQFLILSNDPS